MRQRTIYLAENKFHKLLLEELGSSNYYNPIADGNVEHNPYRKAIDIAQDRLSKFLETDGVPMVSISNGKEYFIYEIAELADLIGKRYCICQLVKDNKLFGSVFIRPLNSFKIKN